MEIETYFGKDRNDQGRFRILVDGKRFVNAGCLSECPEDASLERDLNFVYQIVPMMKLAYEAGKRGDAFVVVELSEDE